MARFLVEHVFRQILEVLVRKFCRHLFQRRHLARLGQVWIQDELRSGGRERDRFRDFRDDCSPFAFFDFVDGRGVAVLKIKENKVIYSANGSFETPLIALRVSNEASGARALAARSTFGSHGTFRDTSPFIIR